MLLAQHAGDLGSDTSSDHVRGIDPAEDDAGLLQTEGLPAQRNGGWDWVAAAATMSS